jgi:peptidoglycan/xylan/chitin deacetylase (PgdA/CDA1 family)
VKWLAAAADAVRPSRRGVVVLLYHRVGGRTRVAVDVPRSLFAEQVAAVAGRATTIDGALAALAGPGTAGPDPVAVTFDDGTADFVDDALPVLAEHGVPVTLYVATDFVERGRAFPGGAAPLSWAALADAVSTGLVTVGSHTHTHALLDRLPPAEVAAELDRSIALIEDRLGVRPLHFAYPKAVAGSPHAAAAVARRFRSAALAGTRPNPYGRTDPYRLARSPVQAADGMRFFARKLAGGMALEDGLRRALNRARYAGART